VQGVEKTGFMKTRNAKKTRAEVTNAQFDTAMQRYAQVEHREAEINKCIEGEVNEVLES
jgi:hypothetical protein